MDHKEEMNLFIEWKYLNQTKKDVSYDEFLRVYKGYTYAEVENIMNYHETQWAPVLDSKSPRRNRRRVRRYVEACERLGVTPNLSQEVINDAYTER